MIRKFHFNVKMACDNKNVENTTYELCKVLKFLLFEWIVQIFFSFQVEAQFQINGNVSEETKFIYLVSQLEPKCVENIWDIVTNNSAIKYSEFETRLLDLIKESESTRIITYTKSSTKALLELIQVT